MISEAASDAGGVKKKSSPLRYQCLTWGLQFLEFRDIAFADTALSDKEARDFLLDIAYPTFIVQRHVHFTCEPDFKVLRWAMKKRIAFKSISLDVQYGGEVINEKNEVLWVLLDKHEHEIADCFLRSTDDDDIEDIDFRDCKSGDMVSLLAKAASTGNMEVTKRLLNCGANPNRLDSNGSTPLFYAAANGNLEIIRELLAFEADINKINKNGKSALCMACSEDQTEVVKEMILAGAEVVLSSSERDHVELTHPICCAAFAGHANIVRILADAGADPNQPFNGGCVLAWASKKGYSETVIALVDAGASIDQITESGWTPLLLAAYHGHVDTARTLCTLGADVNKANSNPGEDEMTPLIWASSNGFTEVVEVRLDAGAIIDQVNTQKRTALSWAAYCENYKVCQLLLAAGSDPNLPDHLGYTSLSWACGEDLVDIIEAILQHGGDPNIACNKGRTPLSFAAEYGYVNTVKALTKAGGDPNFQDNQGRTPLYWASGEGHTNCVLSLLQHKADPSIADKEGKTPLYLASTEGYKNIYIALRSASAETTRRETLTKLLHL